ncbi:uncharacterized protein LOC143181503 isoform X2 [Calliopsis andreniformis]|uniref:uncharacterized protein LOC143181503 isoform X2 n=1 Tax=Calliopsis andreniformis TaxID=337506 RepID=UPI003FCC2AF4
MLLVLAFGIGLRDSGGGWAAGCGTLAMLCEEEKGLLFCDLLPRDIWRRCKDELLCLKCARKYSDWRSLRKHMNFFCQMEPRYPCPRCTHRARIPTLLKYHMVARVTTWTSR